MNNKQTERQSLETKITIRNGRKTYY